MGRVRQERPAPVGRGCPKRHETHDSRCHHHPDPSHVPLQRSVAGGGNAALNSSRATARRTPHVAPRTLAPCTQCCAHCIEPRPPLPRLYCAMATFLQDLGCGFRLLVAATRVHGRRGAGAGARHRREHGGVLARRTPRAEAAAGRAGRRARGRVLARSHAARRVPRVLVSELRGPARADRPLPLAHRATPSRWWASARATATRRVFVNIATANFFDTFGVPLLRGRTFSADEERPGADIPVTILSYGAWQRMGGGHDVVGIA